MGNVWITKAQLYGNVWISEFMLGKSVHGDAVNLVYV